MQSWRLPHSGWRCLAGSGCSTRVSLLRWPKFPHHLRAKVFRYLLVLGVLVCTLFLFSNPAGAATAPSVDAVDARCWRSLVQTGDALCILRYELPQQTTAYPTPVSGTPEGWCFWLTNQVGCGSNPVNPTAPASLQYGTNAAWITVCKLSAGQTGCTGTGTNTGTLYAQAKPPRIWHGLAGAYFSTTGGGGITWADSTVQMCVESTSDFAPTSQDCSPVSWNGEANTQAAQRSKFASDLKAMLQDLEVKRLVPTNSYVQNNLITAAGRVLSLEAYAYADRIAASAFQAAAAQAVQTPYSGTPAGALVLATQIAQTQTAANFLNTSAAGAEWGVSGGFYSTILWIFMGFVAAAAMFKFSGGNVPLTVITLTSVSAIGVFTGGPTLSVIGVVIVIFALLAGWFILTRVPTN